MNIPFGNEVSGLKSNEGKTDIVNVPLFRRFVRKKCFLKDSFNSRVIPI